jgi:hypothetical protein
MRRLYVLLAAVFGLCALCPAAFAQQQYRGVDPNISHFYMARQEVQIFDDAPAVNDMRTQPGPPGSKKGPPPSQRQSLPHAGFMPYSQNIPSLKSGLPTVYNGVPQKAPPPVAGINPSSAKAGAYKGKTAGGKGAGGKSGAPAAPSVAKTYDSYQGYGGKGAAPPSTTASAGATAATHVQGTMLNRSNTSMLHWSRTHN